MVTNVKPIRSVADYDAALEDVEALWGAASGTPRGDQLDVLATLIDAYEAKHYLMDPPDPVEAIKFRTNPSRMMRMPESSSRIRCMTCFHFTWPLLRMSACIFLNCDST